MSPGAITFVRKACKVFLETSLNISEISPQCFKGSFLEVQGFGLGTTPEYCGSGVVCVVTAFSECSKLRRKMWWFGDATAHPIIENLEPYRDAT